MIPLLYLRSSSYTAYDFCAQKFYLHYILGMKEPPNVKADLGNITHKALELLADKKLAQQNGKLKFSNGELDKTWDTWTFSPEIAHQEAWDYYTKVLSLPHKWCEEHRADTKAWMCEAMKLSNGLFNPLKREIIWPEKYFDFTIDKPWAHYDYVMADGRKIEGQLGLKGTVDLVCSLDGTRVIELVDWKTGRRKDWATDKTKEWKDLRDNDAQLRIYHYALCHLLPDVEHIIITIVFINDGGAYSLDFNRKDLEETERIIEKRFNQIRNCTRPRLIYPNWKCQRLCAFGQKNWEGTDQTICAHIQQETIKLGIDRVIQKYGNPEATNEYSGGGRSQAPV